MRVSSSWSQMRLTPRMRASRPGREWLVVAVVGEVGLMHGPAQLLQGRLGRELKVLPNRLDVGVAAARAGGWVDGRT